ncbi:hypothetical protein J2X97_000339 [Epilithonimonas hungarica]|uniref:hypothetical protein n=1 Tax=Epilithonimonas hungarica TaxID=454006 RepID=UPI00278928D6|nr:hypothetical protein [Epilithonimonas hungarica]MDP9954702.1 hypothetical protein [Epilithonimonas hungarica]
MTDINEKFVKYRGVNEIPIVTTPSGNGNFFYFDFNGQLKQAPLSVIYGMVEGIKGTLKISDAAPTIVGKYELADFGEYENLVPIIPFGSDTPTTDPITTEDGYYNAVYCDGTNFIQIKTLMPDDVNNVKKQRLDIDVAGSGVINGSGLKYGTPETEWEDMTNGVPATTGSDWRGIKLERGKIYSKLEIDINAIGSFSVFIADGVNNKIITKNLTATETGSQVFDLGFRSPEDIDSYFGISTSTANLYRYQDLTSNVDAIDYESGSLVNLGKIRRFSYYLRSKTDILYRSDKDQPSGFVSPEKLNQDLGVKKVGFTEDTWNLTSSYFTTSGSNWHGLKLKKNSHYNKIVVFADSPGSVTFVYSSLDATHIRNIATQVLIYGVNYIDINLWVGQEAGYLGVKVSSNILKYTDSADEENVGYEYNGSSIVATSGRAFKFYAESDSDVLRKSDLESSGLLFDFKINNQEYSPDIIDNGGGSYTIDGWVATTPGSTSRITLNRYYSLSERTFICRFVSNNTSQVNFGTVNAIGGDSSPDNYVVDFVNKLVKYKVNGSYFSQSAGFLNGNNENQVEITRSYNNVTFKVTDLLTGESERISREMDGTGGSGAGSLNPTPTVIGLLHDKHCVYLSAGNLLAVKQFTVIAGKKQIDLLHYSDSTGEPEFYYPLADFPDSWIQLMKAEIESRGGKMLVSARSSTSIDEIIDRIKNELPCVRSKFVSISIGTNGGNTESKLSELVEYIFSCGSIPILNNIPCNESGTQVAVNALINSVRNKYGIKGCRFDIPTSISYDGVDVNTDTMYWEDISPSVQVYHHPNPIGAKLMYLRTLIDIPEIYG